MSALDWIRSKAKEIEIDYLDLEPEYATEETPAGRYEIRRWLFNGTLPYRMKKELASQLEQLATTETETEVVTFPGQYRSNNTRAVYTRTVCRLMD